ncbi:MAG: arginase family protein, partial [Gemmatimonadaceae bacterium]
MIALITVPYDSGRRALRMGGGPLKLLEAGAIGRLESARHSVRHVPIELSDQFWTEIGAARRLQHLVADAARDATNRGERPIVLSGNCNSSVGTVAGVGADDV